MLIVAIIGLALVWALFSLAAALVVGPMLRRHEDLTAELERLLEGRQLSRSSR